MTTSACLFEFARVLFIGSLLIVSACAESETASSPHERMVASCIVPSEITATVDIPGGEYLMGDDRFYAEEAPVHKVQLAAFNIDATEVTNRQFSEFVEKTGYVTRAERGLPEPEFDHVSEQLRHPGSAVFFSPAAGKGLNPATWWRFVEGASWRAPIGPGSTIEGLENYPVVHVALEDALAYAEWKGRRLPSEAEWEAAARGGNNSSRDTWGDGGLEDSDYPQANTWQGIFPVINQKTDGYIGAAPVGCFPQNGLGLYDMIGNVWELTSNEFSPVRDAPAKRPGAQDRHQRNAAAVIKGGSYLCAENYCRRYRPAARQPQEWAFSASHVGFRTAKSIDQRRSRMK